MGRKLKISVTVDEELLSRVDRIGRDQSRSAVFEEALTAWVRRRCAKELDRDIEAYYRGMSAAEQAEDERWAALGDETAADWDGD